MQRPRHPETGTYEPSHGYSYSNPYRDVPGETLGLDAVYSDFRVAEATFGLDLEQFQDNTFLTSKITDGIRWAAAHRRDDRESQKWLSNYERIINGPSRADDPGVDFEHFTESRSDALMGVRNKLSGFSDSAKEHLDELMAVSASPYIAYLHDALSERPAQEDTKRHWVDIFATEASDETLITFLNWHVNTVSEQKVTDDSKIAERVRQKKSRYKYAVKKGVNDGWLDPSALKKLKEVDYTGIEISDMFDSLAHYIIGYYRRDQSQPRKVYIAQGVGANIEERIEHLFATFDRALDHEFNHADLGMFHPRWLDEATTEHISLTLGGLPNIINPDRIRSTADTGAYRNCRSLLHAVLHRGDHNIRDELVTLAYSSDSDSTARQELFDQIDGSWGMIDAIGHISALVTKLTERYEKNGRTEHEALEIATRLVLDRLTNNRRKIFPQSELVPA